MIVIYPLVTSKTINPNIIPGVCKALEKYVLVYKLDALINDVNAQLKKEKKKGKKQMVRHITGGMLRLESVDYDENEVEVIDETRPPQAAGIFDKDKGKGKTAKTKGKVRVGVGGRRDVVAKGGEGGVGRAKAAVGDIRINVAAQKPPKLPPKQARETVNIRTPDERSLTVEPTYVQVHTVEGTMILGVKVVSYVIQNDAPLIRLLQDDRYRKSLRVTIHWQTRRILKLMYRLANVLWRQTIGRLDFTGLVGRDLYSGTMTGNWKNDIILGKTKFKGDIFLLINQVDLKADFLRDAKGVKKLFGLFWPSFVVADDINKRVSFCMTDFKGMCSLVNHAFLYSSVSREAGSAFETIDDVRRSAGPTFRLKGRVDKMIQDDLAISRLFDYSKVNLFSEALTPDVRSMATKIAKEPKKQDVLLKRILAAAKSKNHTKITSALKGYGIPMMTMDRVVKIGRSAHKDFEKIRLLSMRVFKNSLAGIPNEVANVGASLIASMSVMTDDPVGNAKKMLAKSVVQARKDMKMKTVTADDWDRELIYAFVFAIVVVVLTLAAIVGIAYILVPVADAFVHAIFWGLSLTIVLMGLSSLGGAGKKED